MGVNDSSGLCPLRGLDSPGLGWGWLAGQVWRLFFPLPLGSSCAQLPLKIDSILGYFRTCSQGPCGRTSLARCREWPEVFE